MYAVFSQRSISLLTNNQQEAMDAMDEQSSMVIVSTINSLQREFKNYLETHSEANDAVQNAADEAVEAWTNVLDMLDESGIDNVIDRVKNNTNVFLQDIQTAGKTGLSKFGEMLTNLGQSLKDIEPKVSEKGQDK